MKYIKSIVLSLIVAVTLSSCNDWLDVNEDPNTPSDATAKIENLLPWCQHYLVYANAATSYRAQFITQALTATSRVSRDGCSAQWEATQSLSTTPYQFFFVGAGPNIGDLYNKAMASKAYHYAGAARLIKAYGFLMMTDLYGEMPYTKALGESSTPEYDNGETIYKGCIKDIEEAIELLQKDQEVAVTPLSAGDSWNGGDRGKWLKMAYLLKARVLNQLSKKSSLYDPDAILAALEKAQKSVGDNTTIMHVDVAENSSDILFGDPLKASPLFSNGGMGGGTTTRPTAWLVNLLTNFDNKGIEDPRADKILPWMQVYKDGKPVWVRSKGVDMSTDIRIQGGPFPISRNATDAPITTKKGQVINPHSWYCDTDKPERWGDTVYVCQRSGAVGYYTSPSVLYNTRFADAVESTSTIYLRPNSPTHWATYAEACFIKAEVLFKKNGAGAAFDAYKEGVSAAITALNNALDVWSSDKALAGIPAYTKMDQDAIDNYLNNAIGTAANLTMEKIMTQKFIAMLYTYQNWNDMRRHDYKDYMGWVKPYEYAQNAGSLKSIPQGKDWRRWKLPSIEINYNKNNIEAIQPNYAADDIYTYPVWWDIAE